MAVLRIYVGIFWLLHGVPKLLDRSFYGSSGWMAGMLREASASGHGPYNDFIIHVVLPNISLFNHLVAWGETLTGISLLLGLLTRLGGAVGIFLPLNYFMLKGSYAHLTALGGLDTTAAVLSATCAVLPAGLVWGLDGVRRGSRRSTSAAGEP